VADHKFEFVVSGVRLSEEQKKQIAGEIALVVTRALVGEAPDALRTPMWSQVNIHGGRMIPDVGGAPEGFTKT
jgi:hypothetical protein